MPKALHFSEETIQKSKPSTISHKGCDTHSESEPDHETQPLQLLRLSSLEEDATSEDTLDSDAHIGGGSTDDSDGDVVMGIPRLTGRAGLNESLRKRFKRCKKSPASTDELGVIRSREKLTRKHVEKAARKITGRNHLLNEEDGVKTEEGQGTSSKVVEDSESEYDVDVLESVTKDKTQNLVLGKDNVDNLSSLRHVQDEVQIGRDKECGMLQGNSGSLNNKAVPSNNTTIAESNTPVDQNSEPLQQFNEYPECQTKITTLNSATSKVKASTDLSTSMEETLAFFLATPPQRRARLGRKRSSTKATDMTKEKSSVSDSARTGNGVSQEEENVLSEENHITEEKDINNMNSNPCEGPGLHNSANDMQKLEQKNSESVRDRLELSQQSLIGKSRNALSKDIGKEDQPSKVHNATLLNSKPMPSDLPLEKTPVQASHMRSTLPATSSDYSSTKSTAVISTPVVNADRDIQDVFSQISPNYADALCQAVDAASYEGQRTVDKRETNKLNTSQVSRASTLMVSSVKLTSNVDTSQIRDSVKTVQPTFTSSSKSDFKSNDEKSQAFNQPASIPSERIVPPSVTAHSVPDDPTSVFRMKSRSSIGKFYYPSTTDSSLFKQTATAAGRFCYPSSAESPSNQIQTTKHVVSSHTPTLMAGILEEVVKEEDVDDDEVKCDGEMDVKQKTQVPHSSSTPANRDKGMSS